MGTVPASVLDDRALEATLSLDLGPFSDEFPSLVSPQDLKDEQPKGKHET